MTDVLAWEPHSGMADAVVSSFGLKTFDREQQRQLAHKVAHLLKPGGSYSFVEISLMLAAGRSSARLIYVLSEAFDSDHWSGASGRSACYRMLAPTGSLGDTTHFVNCLRDAGLEAAPASYFFGCATGARGRKPHHGEVRAASNGRRLH